ncbi:MAG: ArsB/NhaD family transporter [Acidimicrobiales bacterium]
MAAVRIILLCVAVVGVLVRPPRWPVWATPTVLVALGLGLTAISYHDVGDALDPLVEPLVFLLLAVPMAIMLDELGFFAAVAARIDNRRRLLLWLWIFAALVTTIFNLDASVVLLTPLYVRIARRHGMNPVVAGFIPVLLACFASSALVVSNLTNLLAAARFGVDTADFIVRLGPASVVATIVGYVAFRRAFPDGESLPSEATEAVPARALRLGIPLVAFIVIGFTLGEIVGVPVWVVAAIADAVLVALLRRAPWKTLPLGSATLAAALGALAAAAAPDLELERLFTRRDAIGVIGVLGLSVVAANAINNLPAFLIAMPALGPQPGPLLWAVLLGVNIGPAFVVSGSLAGLLWLSTMHRLGVDIDARAYTRTGVRVGLPALVAAAVALLITNALA